MKLEKNEFTIPSLKEHLKNKYGNKLSGEPFTTSDIHSYIKRGYLPHRYGGHTLKMKKLEGVKVITLIKAE